MVRLTKNVLEGVSLGRPRFKYGEQTEKREVWTLRPWISFGFDEIESKLAMNPPDPVKKN